VDTAKRDTPNRPKGLTSTTSTITPNSKEDTTTKPQRHLRTRYPADQISSLADTVLFLSRATLASTLPRGSSPAWKWLRKEGSGNLPRERAHTSQLGVSSAYNPGATNMSLLITINGHATSTLVDWGLTDNFVHTRILSTGISIRR
jgi:hypothetical protein